MKRLLIFMLFAVSAFGQYRIPTMLLGYHWIPKQIINPGGGGSGLPSGCTGTTGNITCATLGTSGSNGGIDFTGGDGTGLGTRAASHGYVWGDTTAARVGGCYGATCTFYPFGQVVASGTSAMGTSAISSGACATVVTTSATGTLTTDVIVATPNGDPTGVTGYAVSATGSLYIVAYPTANNVNFKVCNNTSGSLTPSALTLNWKVAR